MPALHHGGSGLMNNNTTTANKSRSINNLIGSSNISGNNSSFNNNSNLGNNSNDQGFYQNLSVYRATQQNQSQPNLGDRLVFFHFIFLMIMI